MIYSCDTFFMTCTECLRMLWKKSVSRHWLRYLEAVEWPFTCFRRRSPWRFGPWDVSARGAWTFNWCANFAGHRASCLYLNSKNYEGFRSFHSCCCLVQNYKTENWFIKTITTKNKLKRVFHINFVHEFFHTWCFKFVFVVMKLNWTMKVIYADIVNCFERRMMIKTIKWIYSVYLIYFNFKCSLFFIFFTESQLIWVFSFIWFIIILVLLVWYVWIIKFIYWNYKL